MATCAVVLAVVVSGCEPLDQGELSREIEGVASLASEGAVLADEVAQQETKRTFARVQARQLSDSAEHSAERLTDAHPAEGLAGATDEAIVLSNDVSEAIGQVEVAPDDATGADEASERLRALVQKLHELEDSL